MIAPFYVSACHYIAAYFRLRSVLAMSLAIQVTCADYSVSVER